MLPILLLCCGVWALCAIASAKEVLEVQGVNFELALSTHKYLAVLFYDDSVQGERMEDQWAEAATYIESLPNECDMAKISASDPDIMELIEGYGIDVPMIKIFRRGIMAEYRGPVESSSAIASYIQEDAEPSVKRIRTKLEMKATLESSLNTMVFGFFAEEDIADESDESGGGMVEGYSIDDWGQFEAAADSLRGHASFFVISSIEVMESFKLTENDLPAIFMMANDGDGLIKYTGEMLELHLSEWVLRNSSPSMGELTIATSTGEMYATQFFSSRKLKFILFISPGMVTSGVLDTWQDIADTFAGKAIFTYMTQSVADVLEYFEINLDKDIPMIAAHQPTNDYRFKSKLLDIHDRDSLLEFVAGVVQGIVPKVIKSEPVPQPKPKQQTLVSTTGAASSGPGELVVKAVGSTVVGIVGEEDKDVLLAVYTPWCPACKKLVPSYNVLAKAVQGEPRVVIAKINAAANDIPSSWGVKGQPALLWFPAKDKPYTGRGGMPQPRPYWDAGYSLPELVAFVQREGSWDPASMRVATPEQLGSLMGDEEQERVRYDEEEHNFRRNEGREVFEDAMTDYFMGEVVFDGKRWHVAVAGVLAVICVVLVLCLVAISMNKPKVIKKKKA